MVVRDVMKQRVRYLREQESLELAAAVLRFWRFRHLPVLDAADHVVGMVTPADVLEAVGRRGKLHRFTASEVMRCPVETARADEPLDLAVARMRQARVHALPVVDAADRMVGIVTDVDILSALAGERRAPLPFENVRVEKVMSPNPRTIDESAPLADAAEALLEGGFRHLPVLDGKGELVGIISERDVRTHLGMDVAGFPDATLEALSEPVSEAMTPDPISVKTGTPLGEVLETFTAERVGALPVVDEGDRLVGIVSYVDLLAWLRDDSERRQEKSP